MDFKKKKLYKNKVLISKINSKVYQMVSYLRAQEAYFVI